MTALCLSDELVEQYLKFKFDSGYDRSLVAKLFKYIQPASVSIEQHQLFQDISARGQFESDPIISLVNIPAEQLVNQTSLKLQLVTQKNQTVNFTQLNIQSSEHFERLNMLLAGTHSASRHKQEAINHIKALLSDAEHITITDKYLLEQNSWGQCKRILAEVLPRKVINITLITEGSNKWNQDALKAICESWNIKGKQIGRTIHDRYIETDKVKILLSSGIYHLSCNSDIDLTYVVKIKN